MPKQPLHGVQAVILDWAGTTVDFGCFAPVECIVEVFGLRGVEVSVQEARGSMGLGKRDHLLALLKSPAVTWRWAEATGAAPRAADVESLFDDLEPALVEAAARRSTPVRGVRELCDALRARGAAIGTTTGYSTRVMAALAAEAAREGYMPDVVVTPGDVPAGRPAPFMCYLAAARMGAFPLWQMVKIGDTPADMHEGANAGMWCIGLTESGNEVGMAEHELGAMPPLDRQAIVQAATQRLRAAGAHYVAAGPWDCLTLIEEIDARICRGERPAAGDRA